MTKQIMAIFRRSVRPQPRLTARLTLLRWPMAEFCVIQSLPTTVLVLIGQASACIFS